MRRRYVLVLPLALALLTAACGSDLPKLPGQAAGGAKAEAAGASLDMRLANFHYELKDGVSTDTSHAKAYKFASVDIDAVKQLAEAFDVPGKIKADQYGWSIGQDGKEPSTSTTRTLYVGKDGSFSVSEIAPPSASCSPGSEPAPDDAVAKSSNEVNSSDAALCPEGAASTPTTVNPTAKAPTKAQAITIAKDAFKAAGVKIDDDAKVETTGNSDSLNVAFKPVFDGRSVDGYEMNAAVARDKSITYASGQLAQPKSVGSYDLATLKRAVERLNEQNDQAFAATDDLVAPADAGAADTGVAADAGAVDDTPVTSKKKGDYATTANEVTSGPTADPSTTSEDPAGVPNQGPTTVTLTAVQVGLMMQSDGVELWLVPAYLFESDNGGQVVTQAADDKYIAKPTTPTTADGGDGSGTSNSGGGSTGSTGSAGSGSVEPTPAVSNNCAETPVDPNPDTANAPIYARVCTTTATTPAGHEVKFSVDIADADRAFVDGPCGNGVTAEYGDNGPGDLQCEACATSLPSGGGKATRLVAHLYEKAGNYTATFTIKSGLPCGPADPHDSVATVSVPVVIT